MNDLNDLLESALNEVDNLMELLEEAKGHEDAHEASFDDIVYELGEIKITIEDQMS